MVLPINPPLQEGPDAIKSTASKFVENVKAHEAAFSKTVAGDELYSMVLMLPDGSIISIDHIGAEDPDMVVIEGVNEGNQKLTLLIQMQGIHIILVKYKKDQESTGDSLQDKIVGYQLHRKNNPL